MRDDELTLACECCGAFLGSQHANNCTVYATNEDTAMTHEQTEPPVPAALAEILDGAGWACSEHYAYCTREFGGYLGITVETIRGRRCAYVEDGDGNLYPTHVIYEIADLMRRIEAALGGPSDE